MPMQEDRRKHSRHPCRIEVSVRSRKISYPGTILDYSEGGAFIASLVREEVGNSLELRFRHPIDSQLVVVDAVVRRIVGTESTRQGSQGVGVQFNKLLPMAATIAP